MVMLAMRPQLEAIHSLSKYGGVHTAANNLAEEMRDMSIELRVVPEENQCLQERASAISG